MEAQLIKDVAEMKAGIQYIKEKVDKVERTVDSIKEKDDEQDREIAKLNQFVVRYDTREETMDDISRKRYMSNRIWYAFYTALFTALNLGIEILFRKG